MWLSRRWAPSPHSRGHFRTARPDPEMKALFHDHTVDVDHGRRSLHSGAIVIGARACIAFIQVGSVLLLARLLSPEDYGLVSMVTVLTTFAPLLVSLGTPDAVVQRRSITEGEVSALFWISMTLGCTCALLLAASGPLIARFYGEPRLTTIAAVSAITFVASALTCQHYALLRRGMRFVDLAALDVGSNLLSAVAAIALAYYGLEYWALVIRPVLMNALLAAGVWLRCRWIPPRPTMTPAVKAMLGLGLHSTGFSMTDVVGRSSDRVGIGYRSGATTLGYYQNALFIYDNLLDLLVSPLHGVAVSSLSKTAHDPAELHRLWSKALTTLAFFAMPAFGILAVVGQELIVLLLGAKWGHSGVLLSILAVRGIPHSVERTLGWLHVAAGRTDRWMRWGVFATCGQLIAMFCGLPFGAQGVAVAYVIFMFVLFIPAVAYSGQPLGIGARAVIAAIWRPLAASLLAVAVGVILRYTLFAGLSAFMKILALGMAYAGVYLVTAVVLLGVRMPIAVVGGLVLDILPTRLARLVGAARLSRGHD